MRTRIVLSALAIVPAFVSAEPTTQPPQQYVQTRALQQPAADDAPTINSIKFGDFNINYRPPAPVPVPNKQNSLTITGTPQSGIDLWKSSTFNGQTVWNRPAVNYQTLHAIKDKSTGQLFYYRDFANTEKVPLQATPYRDQIGTWYRASPSRELPLIDDRPKQQK